MEIATPFAQMDRLVLAQRPVSISRAMQREICAVNLAPPFRIVMELLRIVSICSQVIPILLLEIQRDASRRQISIVPPVTRATRLDLAS
jgi:hypothetical protein